MSKNKGLSEFQKCILAMLIFYTFTGFGIFIDIKKGNWLIDNFVVIGLVTILYAFILRRLIKKRNAKNKANTATAAATVSEP